MTREEKLNNIKTNIYAQIMKSEELSSLMADYEKKAKKFNNAQNRVFKKVEEVFNRDWRKAFEENTKDLTDDEETLSEPQKTPTEAD